MRFRGDQHHSRRFGAHKDRSKEIAEVKVTEVVHPKVSLHTISSHTKKEEKRRNSQLLWNGTLWIYKTPHEKFTNSYEPTNS